MKPLTTPLAAFTLVIFLCACGDRHPAAGHPFSSNNSSAPLIDSAKLKGDLDDILSSIQSGKPDTTKLKKAGADILNTAASVLSDSGMDVLYGTDNPAANTAKGILEKLRNATGITPKALDSMKQAANKLLQK